MRYQLIFILICIYSYGHAQNPEDYLKEAYLNKKLRKVVKLMGLDESKLIKVRTCRTYGEIRYFLKENIKIEIRVDAEKAKQPKAKTREEYKRKIQDPKLLYPFKVYRIDWINSSGERTTIELE